MFEFDINPYFNKSCFSGYGSDSNGFYSVYRDLFEKIKLEE